MTDVCQNFVVNWKTERGRALFYAHRTDRPDKSDWQLLRDHLRRVAELSGSFADAFGAREWGEAVGLLHDLGKYSAAFQKRLEGSSERVDHSTAGAQVLATRWRGPLGRLAAYVVAGHHAGLPDFGTEAGEESCLARRLTKPVEPFDAGFSEIAVPPPPTQIPIQPGISPGLQFSMFVRMLFSCLVDADSLDTEAFCDPERAAVRASRPSGHAAIAGLLEKYEAYMRERFSHIRFDIDRLRRELLQECLEQADDRPGLWTLTMPTGSGKTLTSLGFALRHAAANGLARIIYVIPYTSIIEQTAAVFRDIFGADHVLEHHSNLREERDESDEGPADLRMRLAEENWDAPIVVTTNVQFFESLFSNRRSKCRKLHNIARSVVILDEAQMLNGGYYRPCLYALEELVRNYRCSVVLCTATQPKIAGLLPESVRARELTRDVDKRYDQFRRVRVESLGRKTLEDVARLLIRHEQALCIVNTRNRARLLYEKLLDLAGERGFGSMFHLSARMCAEHRSRRIAEIRRLLDEGKPCLVVSTQLIEAGVDVDFPVVYRELAGLDSIAQAAGRCNRNGRLPTATAYVFEPDKGLPPGWFSLTASVALNVLERHADDPLSPKAVSDYFEELFAYQTAGVRDRLDEKGILDMLAERAREAAFPFERVSREFRLIETEAKPVLIPFDRTACEAIDALRSGVYSRRLLRRLQPYVVQIYSKEFEAFRESGELEPCPADIWVLRRPERWYDDALGLKPFSPDDASADVLEA
ncbi:MAG: hypothetical protein BLM47_06580 [Candidatus Reconcilbacillus cellulovorans]|uniref:CRISPR-associated helicase/endonuclease Cas3 n=1 Tax=Candidatus Reconcilbacillus cellulovorans TaxID=1906605 RepID=A0A2A6E0M1_9BACL|nr:MAG: hypothetical protein BLM47_06580 [Candidatus Reconcilbacillus cellulovorans]